MTDCEHNIIRVDERIVKTYVREKNCFLDQPYGFDTTVEWSDSIKQSEYHTTYCPSGESNCWYDDDEEQILYESFCFECGEEVHLEPMEGLNYTIQKYIKNGDD